MVQYIIATGDFVILLVTAARSIFYFPSGTSCLHERNMILKLACFHCPVI